MKERRRAPVVWRARDFVEEIGIDDGQAGLPIDLHINLIAGGCARAKAQLLGQFIAALQGDDDGRLGEAEVRHGLFARKNFMRRDARGRHDAFERFKKSVHGKVGRGISKRFGEVPSVIRLFQREIEFRAATKLERRCRRGPELTKQWLHGLDGASGWDAALNEKDERKKRSREGNQRPRVFPIHVVNAFVAARRANPWPKPSRATRRAESIGRSEAAPGSS